ncbi:protein kinase domain-containing protein [Paenibacillus hexagrammi]|uniref:Protein kinase n=1 Tax=Paenibacillus hexagrammi TaxID=2908839 RepID=A0ABY3SEX5_9BACL|nr:protein kinase [Paenibacillus sp. YPD9-1]UJF32357.1 protein kinase [Paenibacillus sp. YPD9-1]
MITVPGYKVLHTVYEDNYIWIAHAYSEAASRVVLLKMAKAGPRAIVENAKLMHEHEVLAPMQGPGILKPHSFFRQGTSVVLVFDIFHGIVLRNYLLTVPMEVEHFLQMAVQLCDILAYIHERDLVHMNVRPDTIIVRPQSLEVCLTGFSDSISMQQSMQVSMLEGSPPYMAPERTSIKRMRIDARTDLYSLGVTFFEMLAGELPFTAKDPLEWAHAHKAKRPPCLSAAYGIPAILAEIVAKLLAKAPSERYQSAAGIRADLQRCKDRWEECGSLASFELGMNDVPPRQEFEGEAAVNQGEGQALRESLLDVTGVPETVLAVGSMPILQGAESPFSGAYFGSMLDMAVVYKASQAITEDRSGSRAMHEILRICVEYAGASSGCWLDASTSNELTVAASLVAEKVGWSLQTTAVPLELAEHVCRDVVKDAAAAHAVVRLNHAALEGRYAENPYIVENKVMSVMCSPVIANDELIGLIYLENNVMPSAFHDGNERVWQMLMKQFMNAIRLLKAVEPGTLEQEPTLLTSREVEVLTLISQGMSSKEIGSRLFLAADTIKVHVRHIFEKLQVNRRIQAVAEARRRNLIP